MKQVLIALALILISKIASATTVTANLKDLTGTNVTASTYVQFELKGAENVIPRVSGTNVIVRSPVTAFPDTNGNISVAIQDNATITPANTYYRICIFDKGVKFRCDDYVVSGVSVDLSSLSPRNPITPNPPPAVIPSQISRVFNFTATSLATWTIPHNFGDTNVVCQFFDANNQQIFPDTFVRTNANTATATFTVAQSGFATCYDTVNFSLLSGTQSVVVTNPTANQAITGGFGLTLNGGQIATETRNNAFTGANTHAGQETFSGAVNTTGLQTPSGGFGATTTTSACIPMATGDVIANCYGGTGSTQIQNAINALPSSGGYVYILSGTYNITSTITINNPNTYLIGSGAAGNADAGNTNLPSTDLKWTGSSGGTVVQFSAISGTTASGLKRGGISNILIDCNLGSAAIGLQILSMQGGEFRNDTVFNCSTAAVDLNVVSQLATGEARDAQYSFFSGLVIREYDITTASHGVRIGTGTGANASFNSFVDCLIITKNGNAIEDNGGDNNKFFNLSTGVVSGGTGIGVHLTGTSRAEYFYGLSAGGGLTQDSTSTDNVVFGYDEQNNAPSPTISAGNFDWWCAGSAVNCGLNGLNTRRAAFGRVSTNATTTPTCSVTGAGTGATCTIVTGSSDSWGQASIGTGTTPGSSGTLTLTYSSSFGSNATACTFSLMEGNSGWNARATAIVGSSSQTSAVVNWDNNGVAMTASQAGAFNMEYFCGGR